MTIPHASATALIIIPVAILVIVVVLLLAARARGRTKPFKLLQCGLLDRYGLLARKSLQRAHGAVSLG